MGTLPPTDASFWDTGGEAGAVAAAAPAAAPAEATTSVNCYNCGTPIPVTLTGGLQKIQCPSCGTEGEIG
jgi:hypothetical protein